MSLFNRKENCCSCNVLCSPQIVEWEVPYLDGLVPTSGDHARVLHFEAVHAVGVSVEGAHAPKAAVGADAPHLEQTVQRAADELGSRGHGGRGW